MKLLGEDKETDYVDIDEVRQEILEARKLFAKKGWPVIDVTRRSIEETASEIYEMYTAHHGKDGEHHDGADAVETSDP